MACPSLHALSNGLDLACSETGLLSKRIGRGLLRLACGIALSAALASPLHMLSGWTRGRHHILGTQPTGLSDPCLKLFGTCRLLLHTLQD